MRLEPLHAGGVDLCDPVFKGDALEFLLDLAIAKHSFQGDELAFLETFGEFGEILPGIDAMPLGAILVGALIVLPAFLRGDVENDVLVFVLGSFWSGVLSEATDESDFVQW